MEPLNPADPALRQHFADLAARSLHPQPDIRMDATRQLRQYMDQVDRQSGLVVLCLQLVTDQNLSPEVRSSLAVFLKNTIKASWDGSHAEHELLERDKAVLRENLFGVSLLCPPSVKRQLAEAIKYVADVDFPQRWPQIIDVIAQSFSADVAQLESVLSTAHSVFQRYRRQEQLTEQTRDELLTINKTICNPLLASMEFLNGVIVSNKSPVESREACKALTLACDVFYDLICLDIGDEYTQNLPRFMTVFLSCLQIRDPNLLGSESLGPGPLVELQSSVVNTVILFLQSYDEDFEVYSKEFLRVLWAVVADPNSAGEFLDDLIISIIDLLSAAYRGATRVHLQDPELLRQMCHQVVIPNLTLRQCWIGWI